MERRHYTVIAKIIALYEGAWTTMAERAANREEVAEHFARELAKTYPNFNHEKFMRAVRVFQDGQ